MLVVSPAFFSRAIDLFVVSSTLETAAWYVVISVALYSIGKFLLEQRWLVYQPAENRFLNAIRSLYLEHIISLPVEYHSNRSIGKLDAIVGRGIGGLKSLSSLFVTQAAPLLFDLIATTLAILILVDIGTSLLVLGSIVFYFIVLVFGTRAVTKKFRNALQSSINAQGIIGDTVLNVEGVKTLAIEKLVRQKYEKNLEISHRAFGSFYYRRGLLGLALSFCLITGFSLAVAWTLIGVLQGTYTIGILVLVNAYVLQLYRSIENFGFSYRDARQAVSAVMRYMEIFAETREKNFSGERLEGPVKTVCFSDITFCYPSGKIVLEEFNMNLIKGRITALMGSSGSGKSTILRILLKHYSLVTGKIQINNIPIEEIDTTQLRQRIAVVPQDIFMFKDSLAFNIALSYKPDFARLNAAISYAQLNAVVQNLEFGLDTEIGERGLKLSGGERQRVAIARALYRDPDILIFDEGTSALDGNMRDYLLTTLKKIGNKYVTLLVTHDEEVAGVADEIVRI